MENRAQCVGVDDVVSGVDSVGDGMAQGSLVGPLFFTIFMNDLPPNVPAHAVLYADDTTLVARGEERTVFGSRLTCRHQWQQQTTGLKLTS